MPTYSGTPNTAQALLEEEAVARRQGTQGLNFGYTPAPQPASTIASWAQNTPTTTANSTAPYLSDSDTLFNNSGYRQAAESVVPTEAQAYQAQLAMRQGEIDAANKTYNVLLNQTRQKNIERTGSAGARQARAGLLGSERGAAIDTNTDVFNEEQVQSVEAQRQAAIQSIYGFARADAAKMIADKQAAKKNGYDATMENIGQRKQVVTNAVNNLVQRMLQDGTPMTTESADNLAKIYGSDKDTIVAAYKAAKAADEKDKLETQKTQGEISKNQSEILKNQGMTLSKDQTYVQYNPKTGKYETMASGVTTPTMSGMSGTYVKGENVVVDSWAQRIFDGTAKITDIPAAQAGLRNAVTVALQASGNDLLGRPTVTEIGLKAKETAKSLLEKFNGGKGTGAVGGSRFWTGGALTSMIPGSDQANLVNDFNSLKAQLSLEGSKLLKGQGAVSDAERAMLGQAVTKLNLSQSESEFKTTLEGIINTLNGSPEYKKKDNNSTNTWTPEKQTVLEQQGFSAEEIEEYKQSEGFISVGGDTNKASQIAMAIKQVESGGNYNAVGDAGTSKGAYQFQPASWSGWAKDYLGNANAAMTPENQDKVAIARIEDLLNQGYDEREIALIWNGGSPVVKKGFNKKIGLAYDSGAYAEKVLKELNKA